MFGLFKKNIPSIFENGNVRNYLESDEYRIKINRCLRSADYFLAEKESLNFKGKACYIDYCLEELYVANKVSSFGVIEGGGGGFILSKLNSFNKYSLNYKNCTGVVAIGKSKRTGKNISMLSHQDPVYFLSDKKSQQIEGFIKKDVFKKYFKTSLQSIKEQCVKGTLDIIIVGGNNNDNMEQYGDSIKLLDKMIFNEIGFHPFVYGLPKLRKGVYSKDKGVFLDTKNRTIHYYNTSDNVGHNVTYIANKIDYILKNKSKVEYILKNKQY